MLRFMGGPGMTKALLGHVGGPDPRLLAEICRLRHLVRDLEAEILRIRQDNDALAVASAAARSGAGQGERHRRAPADDARGG